MAHIKYAGPLSGVVLPDGTVCAANKAVEVKDTYVKGLLNSGEFEVVKPETPKPNSNKE